MILFLLIYSVWSVILILGSRLGFLRVRFPTLLLSRGGARLPLAEGLAGGLLGKGFYPALGLRLGCRAYSGVSVSSGPWQKNI